MSKEGENMEQPTPKRRIGESLATVFVMMRSEFSHAVVERALRFRAKASARVRSSLESTLRSGVQIRGFRDASKANPQQLSGPILTEIDRGHARLAGAVLRVWDESQAPLRACVAEHLRAEKVALAKPDYKASRFPGTWLVEEWVQHRETLAAKHQEFNEDEVALMLCLVSGRAPVPELKETVTRVESRFFQDMIDKLFSLSSESPAWSEIDLFTAAASKIAVEKSKEKVETQTRAVADALEHIQAKCKEEIKYLGLDVRLWFAQVKGRLDLVTEASTLLRALTKELEAYRPIRPQGSSREEERRRAKERNERESAILSMARAWDEIAAKPAPAVAEVADERAVLGVGGATASSEELEQLRTDYEELDAKHQQMVKDRDRLKDANSGLQLEKKQLKEQLDDDQEELAQSKTNAQYWREQYEAEKARVDGDEGVESADFTSIANAISRAETEHPKRLLFALNSKSSIDMPFEKPQEVFAALTWLATEYQRELPENEKPDFPLSIRKACSGWFYKPNQTKTTMGMFSDWYRTTVNGRTYELSNHIGKGNSFDPRSTIRIAFAWDDEKKQVVVGYIGTHQRNRQS